MENNDYDEDGNNIVPCPICLNVHCPGNEGGKCPREEEFAKDMSEKETIKKIQEAVPEIMELKEGCKVINNWSTSHGPYTFIKRRGRRSVFYSEQFKNELEMEDRRKDDDREPFTIIGRDITLEDVFVAIKKKEKEQNAKYPNGIKYPLFYNVMMSICAYEDGGKDFWKLNTPYHLQEQDTKDFIGNLLNK